MPTTRSAPGWITAVVAAALAAAPASAADPSPDAPASKRGFVFPPFRKKHPPAPAPAPAREAAPVVSSDAGGLDPDAPADVPPPTLVTGAPTEGIWDWVDRMEGEIPSPEQVAAVAEVAAEHESELPVTDDLAGAPIPLEFYEDPAAALAADPLSLDRVDPKEFDIPVEVNDAVEKWVRYFTGPGRSYYARWLARSTRYQPMMREALAEAGLPQDLVYLSMIESGYNPHAYSRSDAAGLWQFIPSTGKAYDLRIDWWVDDRRDPEASLEAAVTFLGELHHMFGDWRLAWASYNGGPGRVRRAVEKAGTKDFWTIAGAGWLHPETENYVPKIMAAAIVGKHPERYGFEGIRFEGELEYDVVDVSGSVSLEVLARCAGTTLDELKGLNPGLRRFATPPEGYPVRVPAGRHDTFVAALAKVPASERIAVVRHTVKRGETLAKIAARYGSSVEELSRANQLENIDRIVVGMTLVVPHAAGTPRTTTVRATDEETSSVAIAVADDDEPKIVAASVAPVDGLDQPAKVAPKPAASKGTPKVKERAPATVTHTVARGDSLSVLARKYGTSVAAIRSANGLKSETILVGQKLTIPAGTAEAAPQPVVHVVAKGEWLKVIADRYGVTLDDLLAWNALTDPSHIEVGDELTIYPGTGHPAAGERWAEYTVRAGDSLSKIAVAHNCSVADLRAWNGLGERSVIQPGQKLKVKGT